LHTNSRRAENITLDLRVQSNQVQGSNLNVNNFEHLGQINTGNGNDIFQLGNVISLDGNINSGFGVDILIGNFSNYGTPIFSNSNSISSNLGTLFYSGLEKLDLTGTLGNDGLDGLVGDDLLRGGEGRQRLSGWEWWE
jgi:hypothetical protein